MVRPPREEKNVFQGMLIMLVLSLLLFWIPVLGPLAAGFIGGRKAGTTGSALLAAILPALLAGGLLFLLVNAFPGVAPWLAALVAGAFTLWLVVQAGLVLLGALAGGASAERDRGAAIATVR